MLKLVQNELFVKTGDVPSPLESAAVIAKTQPSLLQMAGISKS